MNTLTDILNSICCLLFVQVLLLSALLAVEFCLLVIAIFKRCR